MATDPSSLQAPPWSTPPADDEFAAQLRGFGPVGLPVMFLVLLGDFIVKPLSAVLVLAWAWRSRTPWRDIGFGRPRSWTRDLVLGIAFGAVLKLLLKAIVMPLLGADPVNQPYHYLVGNRAALPGMLYLMVVGAGFGEETLYRGYLFERLGKLVGTGHGAKAFTVLFTSALFALGHYANLGLTGVEQAMITGLVFGTIFAMTGQLWLVICAHAAYDLVSLAIIYWDVETEVAHLVFS